MSAINSVNVAQPQKTAPSRKQTLVLDAVCSAAITPFSLGCYEFILSSRDGKPNMKFKDYCVRIADKSKEGISKIFNKVGLTKLSEKYLKIARKPALAVELGLHFLTILGGINLLKAISKQKNDNIA